MGDLGEALVRLLPALAVVTFVPLAVLWWSKQRRIGGTRQWVRITTKTPLGKNNWIAVVEADERRFLVGTGERGISLIAELEQPENFSTGGRRDGSLDALADPRMGLIRRLQERTLRRADTIGGSGLDPTP